MKKNILIGAQLLATALFIDHYQANVDQHWASWAVPLAMIICIAINSVWFTRFLSWVIFAVSFFCLMAILSAFTLRWRLQPGFAPMPFYKAMLMYTVFVYVSLGQIKIIGGRQIQGETK